MHDVSWKVFVAILMMFLLYYGLWWYLYTSGIIQFKDFSGVSSFLLQTISLWSLQILFNCIAGSSFTFSDHGFQLTVISLVNFFTLTSTSGLGRYSNSSLGTGLLIITCLMAFIIWVKTSKQAQNNTLPRIWRFANLVSGLIAAQVYVYISIKEEIVSWQSLF